MAPIAENKAPANITLSFPNRFAKYPKKGRRSMSPIRRIVFTFITASLERSVTKGIYPFIRVNTTE